MHDAQNVAISVNTSRFIARHSKAKTTYNTIRRHTIDDPGPLTVPTTKAPTNLPAGAFGTCKSGL